MGEGLVKLLITFVFLSCLFTVQAYATESYLCVADMVTGFQFNEALREWHTSHFKRNSKYLISKSKVKGYAWEVKPTGSKFAIAGCRDDFDKYDYLYCEDISETFCCSSTQVVFRMNKNRLRYDLAYLLGYWTDNDLFEAYKERDDNPYIEIGKCRPL